MIDERKISELVDRFYAQARLDPLLGPVFSAAIGADWDPHLVKMKAFWSTVMLGARTYKGNPRAAHLALPLVTRDHFDRWLELWRPTARDVCGPDAEAFIQRAENIADTLWRTRERAAFTIV